MFLSLFQSSVGNTSLQLLGIHYSNAFYSTLLSFFVLKIFWFHFQIQTICTELIVASLYEYVIVVITIQKSFNKFAICCDIHFTYILQYRSIACKRYIPTNSHRLKCHWKKMTLFLFTIEIFRSLQLKYIK